MYASATKKPLGAWAGKGSQEPYAESSPLSSLHKVSGKQSAASINENKSQKIAKVVDKIPSSHAAPAKNRPPIAHSLQMPETALSREATMKQCGYSPCRITGWGGNYLLYLHQPSWV